MCIQIKEAYLHVAAKQRQRMKQRFGCGPVILLITLAGSLFAGAAFAAQSTFDLPAYVPGELIVRFRAGISDSDRLLARAIVRGSRIRAFGIVDGLEVIGLPAGVAVEAAMNQFKQHQDILYAEPNYLVRTTATPDDQRFGELWGLLNTGQFGGTPGADIDAPRAWDITNGNGSVVVAVIDTGIDYNHKDLSANMFRNAADCNSNGIDDDGNGYIDDCFGIDTANSDRDPMDDHKHGTHVAGTIGAIGNNALGVVGVNWHASLMACKFLGAAGSGTTSAAIACLDYVKTMKDRGVNIVATNNSWGGGGFSQALYEAIDAHRQSGILFIAAAGNASSNNDASTVYPAGYFLPNMIAVAATDRVDDLAYFSNYGRTTVHLGAPGSEILSTTPGNSYSKFSGTSMAAPHVTGVAALLKAQDPNRDWRAIKNLILSGGDDTSALNKTITGKRLNAFGALACADSPLFSRVRPIGNSYSLKIGEPLDLAALNINCDAPAGEVQVTVNGGQQIVTLSDSGPAPGRPDRAAGDGIYSGQFTATDFGTFTLSFPDGDIVTVVVRAPEINITPSSHDFANVSVDSSADRSFTVRNVGGGTLSGVASASDPFSIVSGASYSLGAGASKTVTVRFSPPSAGTFSGNVNFTGGGGTSAGVVGAGVVCSSADLALGETRTTTLSDTDCDGLNGGRFTDLYTFAGNAVRPVRILMHSTDFHTYLRLRDPNGAVVAWNNDCPWGDSKDSCIPYNALTGGYYYLNSSGVYTIEATSYFTGATGTYTMSLNPLSFTLNIRSVGTGKGYVTISGAYCGANCTNDYPPGTRLTLSALAESGSTFAGWGGACSGTGNCALTMNISKTVTATFVTPLLIAPASPP